MTPTVDFGGRASAPTFSGTSTVVLGFKRLCSRDASTLLTQSPLIVSSSVHVVRAVLVRGSWLCMLVSDLYLLATTSVGDYCSYTAAPDTDVEASPGEAGGPLQLGGSLRYHSLELWMQHMQLDVACRLGASSTGLVQNDAVVLHVDQ